VNGYLLYANAAVVTSDRMMSNFFDMETENHNTIILLTRSLRPNKMRYLFIRQNSKTSPTEWPVKTRAVSK
jgi:hypothetical protein